MIEAPGYRRFLELPESDRALLRDRARETAAPPKSGEAVDLLALLEIETGGQLFALPLDAVEGVIELRTLAAVPRPPSIVRGLVTFRGEVLLAVDLSRLHGGGQGLADLRRVVAVSAGARRVGLLTHKELTVRLADPASFKATGEGGSVIGVDARHVALLDPTALIAQIFAAAEARRA